jgi:hypothetical protein
VFHHVGRQTPIEPRKEVHSRFDFQALLTRS